MDSDLWKHGDVVWALREAAKDCGFMPHAEGTAGFLTSLETAGLLRRSEVAPVWHITDRGRDELTKLTSGDGQIGKTDATGTD